MRKASASIRPSDYLSYRMDGRSRRAVDISKTSGVGWTTLSLDTAAGTPTDIRNDITNFNFATPRASADWTGVDRSAMERGLLLADFSGQLSGIFNAALSHTCFSTVTTSSATRTLSLGVAGVSLPNEVILTDYQITRGNDGNLTTSVPFSLADGTIPTWA